MTLDRLIEIFEEGCPYGSFENMSFENIPPERKLSNRQDLNAFLLLNSLFPDETGDIVSAAEHDEIYLNVDIEELAEKITEEQARDLTACGVGYESSFDCLYMNV